ncbi:uncharacterized protein METZ01_LOCUS91544, partial [marine metagenome]
WSPSRWTRSGWWTSSAWTNRPTAGPTCRPPARLDAWRSSRRSPRGRDSSGFGSSSTTP